MENTRSLGFFIWGTTLEIIFSLTSFSLSDDLSKDRFFVKRINNSSYQEIDVETFNSINNRENKYDYNLYQVGSIKWQLIGNVYQANAN